MGQLFKNVASQKLRVFAFADSGHASLNAREPVTGDAGNITAYFSKDNAALGSFQTAANPSEVDSTNAPGMYEFSPIQTETDCNVIEFYPVSSTAGVQVITVGGNVQTTQPPNFPDLGIESDGDLTKVNTLNGHTAQTGDSFSRLGAPAGTNIATDIANARAETEDYIADLRALIQSRNSIPVECHTLFSGCSWAYTLNNTLDDSIDGGSALTAGDGTAQYRQTQLLPSQAYGADFDGSTLTRLDGNSLTIPSGSFTLVMRADLDAITTVSAFGGWWDSGANKKAIDFVESSGTDEILCGYSSDGSTSNTLASTIDRNAQKHYTLIARYDADADTLEFSANGETWVEGTSITAIYQTDLTVTLGAILNSGASASAMNGTIEFAGLWSRKLTDAECHQLRAGWTPGDWYKPVCMVLGDSIAYGYNTSSTKTRPWPGLLYDDGYLAGYRLVNLGRIGQALTTSRSTENDTGEDDWSRHKGVNPAVVFLSHGINDVREGVTGATLYAANLAVAREAVDRGATVYMLTILPWAGTDEQSLIDDYNTLVLATDEPGIIPIDTYTGMEDPGTPDALRSTDLVGGGDTLHLNATGHARLAGIIAAALTSVDRTARLTEYLDNQETRAVLDDTQGHYAPAKAGDEMDLVNAPNATAVTAIQSGLSTFDASADAVITDAASRTASKADVSGLSTLTASQINAEVLDVIAVDTLIDGKTLQQAIRIVAAAVAGLISNAGEATETYKGLDETTTRLTVSVNAEGDRTAVTYG